MKFSERSMNKSYHGMHGVSLLQSNHCKSIPEKKGLLIFKN